MVIWSVFEISIPELIAWGIGEWHMIALLESGVYIVLQPIFSTSRHEFRSDRSQGKTTVCGGGGCNL
jgi:hypothetical protein